ncbi:hypothetical protein P8452_52079 [Trifolium repens]|nr:hypothetical protein P8452_52079 [Trifolium repens]
MSLIIHVLWRRLSPQQKRLGMEVEVMILDSQITSNRTSIQCDAIFVAFGRTIYSILVLEFNCVDLF